MTAMCCLSSVSKPRSVARCSSSSSSFEAVALLALGEEDGFAMNFLFALGIVYTMYGNMT